MQSFDALWALAAERAGGAAALEARLPSPTPPERLERTSDARWLSTLSRFVFSAGFNWGVVADKWPGFEAAFRGFNPAACAHMDDEALEAAAKAGGIGHMAKARAIRQNALLLQELAAERGTASAALAHWPCADFAGLLALLKRRGGRLGGTTASYALRAMGRDGYILSADVVRALTREDVVTKAPTSARDMAAVQAAFNAWADQSGRPLMAISRVLAGTVP